MNDWGMRHGIGARRGMPLARREVLRRCFAYGTLCMGAVCVGGCARVDAEGEGEEPTVVSDRLLGEEAAERVPSMAFAQALVAGELQSIRLVGDSITAGWGCDGYGATGERVIYDGPYGTFWETAPNVACWANDMREYATALGVEDFANAGIAGAKMRWLSEDAAAWTREGADGIVVMLGTNDAVYESEERFAELAEEGLTAAAEACEHLLVLAPPDNARTDAYNSFEPAGIERVLRELCGRHGWEFVSLFDAIELGTEQFCPDQLHPSSAGSHALWGRLRAALGI